MPKEALAQFQCEVSVKPLQEGWHHHRLPGKSRLNPPQKTSGVKKVSHSLFPRSEPEKSSGEPIAEKIIIFTEKKSFSSAKNSHRPSAFLFSAPVHHPNDTANAWATKRAFTWTPVLLFIALWQSALNPQIYNPIKIRQEILHIKSLETA